MTSEEVKRKFESMLDIDLLIDSKLAEKRELKRRLTDIKSPALVIGVSLQKIRTSSVKCSVRLLSLKKKLIQILINCWN